jgi:hypothetical protein
MSHHKVKFKKLKLKLNIINYLIFVMDMQFVSCMIELGVFKYLLINLTV